MDDIRHSNNNKPNKPNNIQLIGIFIVNLFRKNWKKMLILIILTLIIMYPNIIGELSGEWFNELVKSWNSINKESKDLGNSDGANANHYTNSFLVGRQLARSPYYYDLGNAEGQIRLGFSAARNSDTLADTYIWSRKIITVSENGGVQVVL